MADLTGKIANVSVSYGTGKLLVTFEFNERNSAMEMVDKLKGQEKLNIKVGKFKQKRSLDANAYCWVLIHKLALSMQITPLEVYRQAIVNVGCNHEIIPIKEEAAAHFKKIWEAKGLGWPCLDLGKSKIPGYRNLAAYYGSSTYDVQQMSQLIDNLVQDCKALDLETLPPDKLALLKEEWDA